MEHQGKDKNSTVAISPDVARKLDSFCKGNGMTKKDFISLSLEYFIREGINPKTHESPKSEITKITKRLDQFFAFMKKQEQDILRPMYADLVEVGRKNDGNFSKVFSNQDALNRNCGAYSTKTLEEIKPLSTKLDSMKNLSSEDNARLRKGLEMLLKLVDEKNKSGLMDKLFR